MQAILSPNLRIGVLRGGSSPEYDVSLKSGQEVLRHLSETHQPFDIFVDKQGNWHMQGFQKSPERILRQVDVIFNVLCGPYGEDGQVQSILDSHFVPYTGSGKMASALAMNRKLAKEKARSLGIKTPVLMIQNSAADELVEESISGMPASCIVLDDFRSQKHYSFLPQSPHQLSSKEIQTIENISKQVHSHLGLLHYSKSDFIVSPRRGIYFLEVNTVPKFSDTLLNSLTSVGSNVKEFIFHLLNLALNRN